MRKPFLTTLTILTAVLSWAQPIAINPQEYDAQVDYYEEFTRIQLQEYDVTIPAIERATLIAGLDALADGNYGTAWHGTLSAKDWIIQNANRKVAVFVLDTGAGYTNGSLKQATWESKARSFTGEGSKIDVQGHSTHVAGIIAGVDPLRPVGLAEELVKIGKLKIIPYKVLNDQGSGYFSQIIAGVEAAVNEARVLQRQGYFCIINMSLGASGYSSQMNAAIKLARDNGLLVIAAAGNGGGPAVGTPANSEDAIAVAAHNSRGEHASFSDYGPEIEASAAGVGIYSTLPNDAEGLKSGTSMAAPMLSALGAIIASTKPEWVEEQVRAALFTYVYDQSPEGWDKFTGFGSFQLDRFIRSNQDPGDGPDKPEPEPEPDFQTTVNHYVPGQKQMWHYVNEFGKVRKLDIATLEVELTELGNSNTVYDFSLEWSQDYFKNTYLAVPNVPEWGHCDNTYWAGQFYEYGSRNAGINAQVLNLVGVDEDGRNCRKTIFDRADAARIRNYESDWFFITYAVTKDGHMVMSMKAKRKRGLFRRIFGKRRPQA